MKKIRLINAESFKEDIKNRFGSEIYLSKQGMNELIDDQDTVIPEKETNPLANISIEPLKWSYFKSKHEEEMYNKINEIISVLNNLNQD